MTEQGRPAWAARLQAERESRGWNKRQTARALYRAAGMQWSVDDPTAVRNLARQILGWESGDHFPRDWATAYAQVFEHHEDELFGDRPAAPARIGPGEQHDALRLALDEALTQGAVAGATLDDWERAVERYGNAARDRPAAVLLDDLAADLGDLRLALRRHRSASALRGLTRVAAQMSGLMCLTLIKLDDRTSFRRWARTARIAASEAGDPATGSWVLAQEAYGHYYAGDFSEAVSVAQGAQHAASGPCVGVVLAAALEARAHAAIGPTRTAETRAALSHAEHVLGALDQAAVNTSAFGYNEAQLRFHEGSAWTHLGDTATAWPAQQRALALCSPGDYLDRTLTRLDRTLCLAHDGDVSGALEYAAEALQPLTDQQRQGIIDLRGRDILGALTSRQAALPAARQLRDILTPISGRKDPRS